MLLPALLFSLTCFAATPAPLTEVSFGFNPAESTEVVEVKGRRFAEYYQKKTGRKVRTFVATDYTALVEALRSGKVHFAFLPAFSLVKAEEVADAKVLLKAVRRGHAVVYSAVITRADKPYRKLADLKGKNVAWVDPASSTGFLVPKAEVKTKLGADPDTFFGKEVFAGAHDAVVLAVANGTVDAGATYVNDTKGEDGSWHLFLKTPEERKKIRMIHVSAPIPGDTLATTQKFAREHPAAVRETLDLFQKMGGDKEGHEVLTELYRIDSMVPAKSSEFEPLRRAAKLVHGK